MPVKCCEIPSLNKSVFLEHYEIPLRSQGTGSMTHSLLHKKSNVGFNGTRLTYILCVETQYVLYSDRCYCIALAYTHLHPPYHVCCHNHSSTYCVNAAPVALSIVDGHHCCHHIPSPVSPPPSVSLYCDLSSPSPARDTVTRPTGFSTNGS